MPNGTHKNWSRVCTVAAAFRARHGRQPERLEVPLEVWGDVRRLFTFGRFRQFAEQTGLIPVAGQDGSAPRAIGSDGAVLRYAEALRLERAEDQFPEPDRIEEHSESDREQWIDISMGWAYIGAGEYFADPQAYAAKVDAINAEAGLVGASSFRPDRPPLAFTGDPHRRPPYVIFSLNPGLGPRDDEILARVGPGFEAWWRFHLEYFALWADWLEDQGRRPGGNDHIGKKSPFWRVFARLIAGLEHLPLPGSPAAREMRMLQELLLNVDILPYSSGQASPAHTLYVESHIDYLDRAIQLGVASDPEVLILNGATFRRLLPPLGVEVPSETVPIPGSGLTLTPINLRGRRAVLFNQFLSGAAAHVSSEHLATTIPQTIRQLIAD